VITSASNERLKRVRKLASAHERDETGLFVAEGEDLVAAALDAGIQPVEAFVDAERPVLVERLPGAVAVEGAVLARVSSLAHPPRIIGVFARTDLPAFVVDQTNLTVPRLDSILQSRGIHGLLVLPSWYAPDWSALNWAHFAGVYTDYVIERPPLHCVCCNHYRSMMAVLARLFERGYRRPGLYLENGRDERDGQCEQRNDGRAQIGEEHEHHQDNEQRAVSKGT